jgi:hypothetical protein
MKALDAGAHGVIVPLVNDRADAERAVAVSGKPRACPCSTRIPTCTCARRRCGPGRPAWRPALAGRRQRRLGPRPHLDANLSTVDVYREGKEA